MYRLPHSPPDSPDPLISEFHHHTSEQSSTDCQPLMGSRTHQNPISQGKHDHVAATPANTYPPAPSTLEASNNPNVHRWTYYIHQGTSYDPSNAKEDYLRMAKDDVPDNKVSSASSTAGKFSAQLGGPHCPRWPVSTSTSLMCPESHVGKCIFSPLAPTPLQWHAFQIRHHTEVSAASASLLHFWPVGLV